MNPKLLSQLRKAGFRGEALKDMYGIVMAESGGDPHAYNPRGRDRSYGLAQINMYGDMGPARQRQFKLSSYDDLFDPLVNLRAAYRISSGGKDFSPWTTYTSGAYKKGRSEIDGIDLTSNLADDPAPTARLKKQTQPQQFAGMDHQALALSSLRALASGEYDAMDALGEMITARREFEERRGASQAPRAASARRTAQPRPVQGGGINLSAMQWRETAHAGGRTSNLGWGDDEPMDIMGAPGTPIGAPSGGRITDHGTAQEGGLALTLEGDDGYEYWLGHIDGLPPVGSKITAGEIIGRISGEHPRPHVHATRRRRRQ